MLEILNWQMLNDKQKRQLLTRPACVINTQIQQQVERIIHAVQSEGDAAVKRFTQNFDGVTLNDFRVSSTEFDHATKLITTKEKETIEFAYRQILQFHETQRFENTITQVSPGVYCARQSRPIQRVGLYVPGGKVPLPSTVLMLGIPALIAGCEEVVMCTPPRKDGTLDPYSLIAAQRCGIKDVYKIGGAQAIAAMSYGTQSIKKVDKVFGPGNAWVTAAKLAVMSDVRGASCDLPAGPSELVIIADKFANAEFIAADLLSQAEHSNDAQVLLITDDEQLAKQVQKNISIQLTKLLRKNVLSTALQFAKIILVENIKNAFDISNEYAPEHLSLQINEPTAWFEKINHAGAVFVGQWTPQTLGDYVIGTTHVLPTYGLSKVYSGLGVNDFMKFINFAQVSVSGLKEIGQHAMSFALIEQLDAHKNAVAIRLRELS